MKAMVLSCVVYVMFTFCVFWCLYRAWRHLDETDRQFNLSYLDILLSVVLLSMPLGLFVSTFYYPYYYELSATEITESVRYAFLWLSYGALSGIIVGCFLKEIICLSKRPYLQSLIWLPLGMFCGVLSCIVFIVGVAA